MAAFQRTGKAQCSPRQASSYGLFGPYDANILGGLLLGAGMTLTGSCPGTVLVQLATGVKSSLYVAVGTVVGGALFSRSSPLFSKVEPSPKISAQPTIHQYFSLDATRTLASFEIAYMSVVAFLALVMAQRNYEIIHPILGGVLIGLAQAATIFLTGSPIGVSLVYEHLGQYVCRALGWKNAKISPGIPNSVMFAVGIMAGSSVTAALLPARPIDTIDVSTVRALFGGAILAIGSRIASGCTSGHGISGLSTLSISSFVTVGAMFGGGIATAFIW